VIKGLLIGFGFLIVMTLIAIGFVRLANGMGEPRKLPDSDPGDGSGRDEH